MGFFTKDIKTLNDLFMHGLQDLYYAENQIMKALPDMIEKATKAELARGLSSISRRPRASRHRLREVFGLLDAARRAKSAPRSTASSRKPRGMGDIDDSDVIDVGLIAAAQAVEHYEITRYGALIDWAGDFGRTDCIPHLKANLAEEKATDQKLTQMSERRFNSQADKKPAKPKQKSTARRKTAKARPVAKAKRAPAKKARRRA